MNIKRGEIWTVNLDPTVGAEIRKTRPVVVISSDAVGALPIRLVAPLTEWKEYFNQNVWHVKLEPDRINGLDRPRQWILYSCVVLIRSDSFTRLARFIHQS